MVTYRDTSCESLDKNLSPGPHEKRFIMFISSVRKTAKKSDGVGWPPLIYFWEDVVLKFMPKQCQSTSTSSSLALLPKLWFCRNWIPIHHVFTSLMCVLAPEVVCCISLQISSLCSWSAVRLSCGTLAETHRTHRTQIWENSAANCNAAIFFGYCTLYSFLRGINSSVSYPENQSNTFLPFKNYKSSW